MQQRTQDPFDAARARLTEGSGRRKRRPRPDGPRTIIPVDVPAADEPLSPGRLEAARTRLRLTTPPKSDDE